LPGKVLKTLVGRPMLEHLIERLQRCKTLDVLTIATTTLAQDDPIAELAKQAGAVCFRGPEDDVLARYVGAAKMVEADIVVRITSDCPLIDPVTVDNVVRYFLASAYDYVAAGVGSGFPRGLDTEVVGAEVLMRAHREAHDVPSREHVTWYIHRHPELFHLGYYPAPPELRHPDWRLCVDEEADFQLIEEIYGRLYRAGEIIDIREVVNLLEREPQLRHINAKVRQKVV